MSKSRFTDEQVVTALREADRMTVAEAAKKHKVSGATIYAWRKHFGRMDATDVKRLKALEQENSRLKELLTGAALDIEVLKVVPIFGVASRPCKRKQPIKGLLNFKLLR